MRLRIKNWKTFQHYDHRCPPWIKLHFKILSSRDWVKASDSERVLAIACMLIASQDEAKDGSFDADPDYIQRVAYLNTPPDFKPLIDREFVEVLADASACKQMSTNGVTEKRQSREETETEKKPVLISERPDSASDVAAFVMQGLGLAGRENRWTIEDAIKRSMESFDMPAMGAASQIVTAWQEYEKADVEFRSGPSGFLKEGKFLSKTRWRLRGDGANQQNQPIRVSAQAARVARNDEIFANVLRERHGDSVLGETGGPTEQRGNAGGGHGPLVAPEPIVLPPERNQ